MADTRIESLCREAREQLRGAVKSLGDAARVAREDGEYQLDKSLTAVGATIEGVDLTLISLPRLKG